MIISCFVIGASSDGERVRERENQLRAHGVVVKSCWSPNCETWSGKDAQIPLADQRNMANLNLTLLLDSQIVWALSSTRRTRGFFFELGFAAAARKPIVISGPGYANTIYSSLARFRDPDDHLGLVEVMRIATEMRRQFSIESPATGRSEATK